MKTKDEEEGRIVLLREREREWKILHFIWTIRWLTHSIFIF